MDPPKRPSRVDTPVPGKESVALPPAPDPITARLVAKHMEPAESSSAGPANGESEDEFILFDDPTDDEADRQSALKTKGKKRHKKKLALLVKDAEDKGKGYFAGHDIPAGTEIICEKPWFRYSNPDIDIAGPLMNNEIIAAKVQALSESKQRDYFQLQNDTEYAPPLGIFLTNAISLDKAWRDNSIFYMSSRFNHSCLPNCHKRYDPEYNRIFIHTVDTRPKGEELTLCYGQPGGNYAKRRSYLGKRFNFMCKCTLCLQPPEQQQKTDANMDEIDRLVDLVEDNQHALEEPEEHLGWLRLLYTLYKAESITDTRLARLYELGFRVAALHSDKQKALAFAGLAFIFRNNCEGRLSSCVEHWTVMKDRPTQWDHYGATALWKNLSDEVGHWPSLIEEQFQRWLWTVPERDGSNTEGAESAGQSQTR